MKTKTVDLAEPIVVKDETYTSLTFRRRKAKDLAVMDLVQGEQRKFLAMLASMADVALPVIEELDADDYERVVSEVMPLMGNSVAGALQRAEGQAKAPNPAHTTG
ncbi:Phage tail assembly chaperone protein, E, or 41 or 14 [Roseivivax halotolerans]|uniref:Phage tail assembly chaperone protein, E, or 41 or 14 n=1 Tax=Roseivivax halotolerans TaxID=93684 RepID=A0A1I5ZGX0_9RHOB|nr:phage tail assembly protein [Roseivivax halotolerans]SFQ55660.1 Phage tail assembly chaperone protein, E, or 41 or 14 [Roseivivax halotolerans]